jgi:hypothetical protein
MERQQGPSDPVQSQVEGVIMRKPKVRYCSVLTRRKKLLLIYVWSRMRVEPEWRHTPEWLAIISSPDLTSAFMLRGQGSEFIAQLSKLAGVR